MLSIEVTFLILFNILSASQAWSPYHEANMFPGRSVIVQMFEWRFDDLAEECERFLGPVGFGGIQVSPPIMEHAIINQASARQPWWQRYQAVSYKLDHSRSGTRSQLQDMIRRCNNANVRVYVDVILNHMTGNLGQGVGSAGSQFNGDQMSYPAVPYDRTNFNGKAKCGTENSNINNYDDSWQLRNCELVGLHDLDQSQEYVRDKLSSHLNELIDMGAGGFRCDASKHMYPGDLEIIFSRLHDLNSSFFLSNRKPFVYHEVSSGGVPQSDYFKIGRVINFPFMRELASVLKKENGQKMKYLKNFGSDWGLLPDQDSINIIDNHDVQREDHYTLSFKNGRIHKMANAFMLAWPYGMPKIMSSYDFSVENEGKNNGPPHHDDYTTKRVRLNGMQCEDGWVCEHRWRQVYNMVRFRKTVADAPVTNWWDNDYQMIAFARQGKGFIAFNNEEFQMRVSLQTSLPPGVYCDVVSGEKQGA